MQLKSRAQSPWDANLKEGFMRGRQTLKLSIHFNNTYLAGEKMSENIGNI